MPATILNFYMYYLFNSHNYPLNRQGQELDLVVP